MKKLSIIFTCLCLWSIQALAQTGTSSLVSIGSDGKLKYTPDANGNTVPDYSGVGYKNGEAPIPTVAVVKTISAVSGDNTANIQNAINAVAAMPLDANGIRGALLLKAGTYNVNNTIYIRSSGVILRGEGNSTIIMATKTSQYNLLSITGSGGPSVNTSTSKQIQGSYIPVGAKTFTLPAGHGFVTGDDVMLQRKPNQAWIHMLGMDVLSKIPCDAGGCNVDWTPEAYTVNFIRKVVAVNGNTITLDAPNVDIIDSKYAQGFIMKYTWSGKIENVGVEKIYFDSKYTNANDEQHGWNAVSFSNSKNCWVTNVEAHHYGYSAVTVNDSGAFTSILNTKNIDPISITEGGRKYSFNINGQRNLVKNCSTQSGRHDYVTGAQNAGPNVFTQSTASNQQADIGPHQRWAAGVLFDVLTSNSLMDAQNRLGYGTGHGWSGAQIMYWNCVSAKFIVQSPTNHMNWAIGCKGTITDVGDEYTGSPCISQSTGNAIGAIPSLYEKQLADRLNTVVVPVTPVPDNLAKGKPVTVSSTEASTTTSTLASNATDGSYSTRWGSIFADPQWLSVDLGANYAVNRVKITWEAAFASAYQIQLSSDNSNWTTVKTVTGNTTTTNDQTGLAGTGRYVRIYGTARATTYGYSIFELEVYGTSAVPNQLPTVNLNSPLAGASFTSPASISIAATAADTDGNISKVEFYNGTTLLSTSTAAPYLFNWSNVATGTYTITAKATDNAGATVTSAAVNVTVSAPLPACLPASASADDGDVATNVLDNNLTTRWSANGDGQWIQFCLGTAQDVSGVQIAFYNGNTRQSIFDVQVSQDGSSWTNVLTGVHSSGTSVALETFAFATQSAKYVRLLGHGNTTSTWNSYTEVKVLTGAPPVNQLPSAAITSPVANASFNAPASILISATAADLDGTISNVEFYNGTTLLGSDNTSPYSFTWTNVTEGTYVLTVKATDNLSASTLSASISVVVAKAPVNQAPTITLTSPVNNASVNAPASIEIEATAADTDGTVSKVEFYNGSTLLASDNTSPYSYAWTNVAAGTYSITAKVIDNAGATTISSAASVKVNAVVSNPCSSLATYKENNGYAAGSKVQNEGKQYQCKPYPYSGWCNGSAWAYAPGTGSYWTDAWTLIGSCASRLENSSSTDEALLTSAPNPFSHATTLTVVVTEAGDVALDVYNKSGQLVKKLSEGYLNTGTYQFSLDGSDLPVDLYIVKYTSNNNSITKKIMRAE